MTELNPTIAPRDGEQLDLAALEPELKAAIPDLQGTPEISQFPAGASNLTYLIRYDNRELVLRRPPPGAKAKGAHSMEREYRIMQSLGKIKPWLPKVVHTAGDDSALGCEYYVMDKIEGALVKKAFPEAWQFGDSERHRFCQRIFDVLIELHNIDFNGAGLADFGKPNGYVKRQVVGWNQRFVNAQTDDVPDFGDVRQWLEQKQPASESRHSVIHGDFRIDNVMVDVDDPFSVVAVLDWEMATLGDPLMDLGNALAYWIEKDDPEELSALVVQPSNLSGMMTRREILDYYGEHTGLDTTEFDFYSIYGQFRLVVIMQQLYYRYKQGHMKNDRFAVYGLGSAALGEHCRRQIQASRL